MTGFLCLAPLTARPESAITGTVLDAGTGQPLANVDVQINESNCKTRSGPNGRFNLEGIPAGNYTAKASTVGYRTSTHTLKLETDETQDLELILVPDSVRRQDTATVHSGTSVFNPTDDNATDAFHLAGNDLKNLATVIADDPLRAVQSVPGVAANDDFEARFSLRGASFNRIGIYLDGIQLHGVVHTLQGVPISGSNSMFNSDLVEEMSLFEGAYPSRFANSSVGALDVHMRDGNEKTYSFRIAANFADSGFLAEGPLGKMQTCSWISGFRKSYLQYLLKQAMSSTPMAFGFQDAQGRLSCRVAANQTLSLSLFIGDTGLDRTGVKTLGPNSLMTAHQKVAIANLGWRYIATDNLLFTNHFSTTQENFDNRNLIPAPLGSGAYHEWNWNSNADWMWNKRNMLHAGFSLRSQSEAGYLVEYNSPTILQVLDRYRGKGVLAGAYVEQGWTTANGHLHLTAGGRWDRQSIDRVSTFTPQAGITFSPWSPTQIQVGWGQYVQFPEVYQLTSNLGHRGLLPIRTTQATVSVEQRLAPRIRLRGTFYNRQDRDLLYQPFLDARLVKGITLIPAANPVYGNSLRGYGRGFEVLAHRLSANGLDGWVSYAYGYTWMHDGVTGASFPSDFDQRHTFTAYASYRIRPTVNLSTRWTYGSGFPIPGFLASPAGSASWANIYLLGEQRNRLRVGSYKRLDVRINKSWVRAKWKTTLYGEAINLMNSVNYRYNNLEAYDAPNKIAYITMDRMFPILPSIGIVFER